MNKLASKYLHFRHHPGNLYTYSKCSCGNESNYVFKDINFFLIKKNGFLAKDFCFKCDNPKKVDIIPVYEYTGFNKEIKYSYKNFNNSTKEYKPTW